jgi:hypothetical protein
MEPEKETLQEPSKAAWQTTSHDEKSDFMENGPSYNELSYTC